MLRIPESLASLRDRVASRSECNQLGTPPGDILGTSWGEMLENPKLFYFKSSHWSSHIRDFPAKTEAEQLFTGSLVRATIINTSPDGQFVWNQPSCHMHCVDLHIFQCVWRVLRDTHICWWCWNAPSSFSEQKMNFQDRPIPPANPGHLS